MRFKAIYIVLIIVGLASVRFIGAFAFYDPLIAFFKSADYHSQMLPEISMPKFIGSMALRYAVNTILTLLLIYVTFQKIELVRVSVFIYILVFLLLMPALIALIYFASGDEFIYLFYVRRILIHPVLTLILLPAFLYHERQLKK